MQLASDYGYGCPAFTRCADSDAGRNNGIAVNDGIFNCCLGFNYCSRQKYAVLYVSIGGYLNGIEKNGIFDCTVYLAAFGYY